MFTISKEKKWTEGVVDMSRNGVMWRKRGESLKRREWFIRLNESCQFSLSLSLSLSLSFGFVETVMTWHCVFLHLSGEG
jgi:hypothetical protein